MLKIGILKSSTEISQLQNLEVFMLQTGLASHGVDAPKLQCDWAKNNELWSKHQTNESVRSQWKSHATSWLQHETPWQQPIWKTQIVTHRSTSTNVRAVWFVLAKNHKQTFLFFPRDMRLGWATCLQQQLTNRHMNFWPCVFHQPQCMPWVGGEGGRCWRQRWWIALDVQTHERHRIVPRSFHRNFFSKCD